MVSDYIRLKSFGSSNNTGYKINCSLTINFNFAKGIETTDLSLPGSTTRRLLPISGIKEDYDVTFEFVNDGTNKAFSVNSSGIETAQNKITTAEQLNFLVDNMISKELGAVYQIYSDWLGKTIEGILTFRGVATGDDYFSKFTVTATLKVGSNILGL